MPLSAWMSASACLCEVSTPGQFLPGPGLDFFPLAQLPSLPFLGPSLLYSWLPLVASRGVWQEEGVGEQRVRAQRSKDLASGPRAQVSTPYMCAHGINLPSHRELKGLMYVRL